MARKKEQAALREEDRVASEQLSVTLQKGERKKLKRESEHRGLPVSAIVREALSQYPFVARGATVPRAARASSGRVKAKGRGAGKQK